MDKPPGIDFEESLKKALGERMRKSDQLCQEVWSALANVKWYKKGQEMSYSFRGAGGLIAEMIGRGDYLGWYCSGPYATVTDEIAKAMAEYDWTWGLWE